MQEVNYQKDVLDSMEHENKEEGIEMKLQHEEFLRKTETFEEK